MLWALRRVATLVAFALLLAYMLDPIVSQLEQLPFPGGRRLPRAVSAFLVIGVGAALIGWLAVIAAPLLVAQLGGFLERLPQLIETQISHLRVRAALSGSIGLSQLAEELQTNVRAVLPQVAGFLFHWVGGVFSRVDQILGFAVLPVLTFYLLADRERVRESMLRFLPGRARESLLAAGPAIHRALQSYVRGQVLVCVTMGVATGSMLATAGIREIVPFLGAFVASLAIGLSGLSLDPWHGLLGLGLYTLNNWLLGAFVTPRVMERYLELHPFAVIVSVLCGAQLLGPPGAILALPVAAVTQALIEDLREPA